MPLINPPITKAIALLVQFLGDFAGTSISPFIFKEPFSNLSPNAFYHIDFFKSIF